MRYVPVDVCGPTLLESAAQLTSVYPEVSVDGIVADVTRDLHAMQSDRPKLVLFLGSTIGNLDERVTLCFLRDMAAMLNPGDRLVLGMDMFKPVEIFEAAYNDSRNVTVSGEPPSTLPVSIRLHFSMKSSSAWNASSSEEGRSCGR